MNESKNRPLEEPRSIIRQLVTGVDKNVLEALPNLDSMARNIRRSKQDVLFTFPNPTALDTINIPRLRLLTTENQELMLYHDTGMSIGTRALIFSTASNLATLQQCDTIAVDGTAEVRFLFFFIIVFLGGT